MAYKSTHERLSAEGFSPEQPLMVRTKVCTMEKGKRYALLTSGMEESVVYDVDDNIIKEGRRCDKLVLVKRSARGESPEQWTEIFIELKGVDTKHAIAQLHETLKKSVFMHPSNERVPKFLALPTIPPAVVGISSAYSSLSVLIFPLFVNFPNVIDLSLFWILPNNPPAVSETEMSALLYPPSTVIVPLLLT